MDFYLDWPRFGISIYSPQNNQRLLTIHTDIQQNKPWAFEGKRLIRAIWHKVPLSVGEYRIDISLWGHSKEIETLVGCIFFEVVASDVYGTGVLPDANTQGCFIPDITWQMNV